MTLSNLRMSPYVSIWLQTDIFSVCLLQWLVFFYMFVTFDRHADSQLLNKKKQQLRSHSPADPISAPLYPDLSSLDRCVHNLNYSLGTRASRRQRLLFLPTRLLAGCSCLLTVTVNRSSFLSARSRAGKVRRRALGKKTATVTSVKWALTSVLCMVRRHAKHLWSAERLRMATL